MEEKTRYFKFFRKGKINTRGIFRIKPGSQYSEFMYLECPYSEGNVSRKWISSWKSDRVIFPRCGDEKYVKEITEQEAFIEIL